MQGAPEVQVARLVLPARAQLHPNACCSWQACRHTDSVLTSRQVQLQSQLPASVAASTASGASAISALAGFQAACNAADLQGHRCQTLTTIVACMDMHPGKTDTKPRTRSVRATRGRATPGSSTAREAPPLTWLGLHARQPRASACCHMGRRQSSKLAAVRKQAHP